MLWPERGDGNDVHAVAAAICRACQPDDYDKGAGRLASLCRYSLLEVEKALGCGIFLSASEFDLDCRPFSIRHFHDGIGLAPVVVPVMAYGCAEGVRIAEKVAQHEAFEEKAERVEVAFKSCRSSPEKRCRDGRIAEPSFLGHWKSSAIRVFSEI